MVHKQIEVEYIYASSQSRYQVNVSLIDVVLFGFTYDTGVKYNCQWMRIASSSKVTVDKYPGFVSNMEWRKNENKNIDGVWSTHTIGNWQVLGSSHTSIYYFHQVVLSLWWNFSHPPSHIGDVFNRCHIFNFPWKLKRTLHLNSGSHKDWFVPSQEAIMPIAWVMMITIC